MRLNLVNTGVRYNATDVRLDSGKALDKTLSPGKIINESVLGHFIQIKVV